MAKQTINVGTIANDGTGDPLRDAMIKVNDNTDEIYGNNIVFINSASDFPTAVSNVITLVADTNYRISGEIDIIADRFDTSAGGITLYGVNANVDKITTTNTGALFTGASVRCMNLGVTVTSGSVFDMSGLGVIALNSFFVLGCTTLGTVNATGLFSWLNSNITALSTSGILFTGVCRTILIRSNSFSNFDGTAIDLGTATASMIRIDANRLSGNVGSTSIDLAPTSANIIALGEGWIVNNLFNGDGTASVGSNVGDDSWTYHDNAGLPNSFRGGDGHILGNATETVIGTISTPVPVNFNASFVADIESSFTVATDGCITYTGATPINISGTATIFGDSATGNNVAYRYYFAKNGTIDIGSVSQEEYDSSDPHSTPIAYIAQLVNGDEVCLYVENITNTTNLTVETCSIHIIGF
ncbi:MAG: hypothetical protein KUG81_05185 [Gammaproteobacteria bacterium]|nr:hypothetical protein [Gammaproteobacteria bacterium]